MESFVPHGHVTRRVVESAAVPDLFTAADNMYQIRDPVGIRD